MQDKVNILGTEYSIIVKKYDDEEDFEKNSISGWCDDYLRRIVLCDLSTWPGWDNEPEEKRELCTKKTLRHEIVHAFFNESGLSDNSSMLEVPWARNEEMVDWFAGQGEKIYKAWQEAGAL
jgi:hypothetical protein